MGSHAALYKPESLALSVTNFEGHAPRIRRFVRCGGGEEVFRQSSVRDLGNTIQSRVCEEMSDFFSLFRKDLYGTVTFVPRLPLSSLTMNLSHDLAPSNRIDVTLHDLMTCLKIVSIP